MLFFPHVLTKQPEFEFLRKLYIQALPSVLKERSGKAKTLQGDGEF